MAYPHTLSYLHPSYRYPGTYSWQSLCPRSHLHTWLGTRALCTHPQHSCLREPPVGQQGTPSECTLNFPGTSPHLHRTCTCPSHFSYIHCCIRWCTSRRGTAQPGKRLRGLSGPQLGTYGYTYRTKAAPSRHCRCILHSRCCHHTCRDRGMYCHGKGPAAAAVAVGHLARRSE
jgi:hypothetical protein